MKMKFKVGDKVIGTKGAYSGQCGIKGTIVGITGDNIPYKVQYDNGVRTYEGKEDIKLIKKGRITKAKPVKFVAIYDENNEDPAKTFTSKKELNTWLTEVRDNDDIVWNSIKVFEVKKEYEVETGFRLKAI